MPSYCFGLGGSFDSKIVQNLNKTLPKIEVWRRLEASWGRLGGVLGQLGASWEHLRGAGADFVSSWRGLGGVLGCLGTPWGRLGGVLGPSWNV